MADETFEIGFEVTNAQGPTKAFEDLKIAQLNAANESRRLAAELRALTASGTATKEQTEQLQRAMIRAQAAAQQYGAQARQVVQAQQQQARASQQTAAAAQTQTAALGRASNATNTAVGTASRFAQAIGQVGSVVGHVSPQVGQFGQIIGQIGGAATAMTGAMGPWGIAIGVATTAIGIAIPLIERYATGVDDAGHQAREAASDIDRMTAALERQNRTGRLERGELSQQETAQALGEAQTRLTAEETRLNNERERANRIMLIRARGAEILSRLNDQEGAAADRQRRQLNSLNDELIRTSENVRAYNVARDTQARTVNDLALATTIAGNREAAQEIHDREASRHGGRGIGVAGIDFLTKEEAAMRDLTVATQKQEEAWQRLYGSDAIDAADRRAAEFAQNRMNDSQEMLAIGEDIAQRSRQWREETEAAARAANDAAKQQVEDDEASLNRKADATKAHMLEVGQITNGSWTQIGDTVQGFAGEMFKFLISGADKSGDAFLKMLDGFLEATAVQYSIKALAEAVEAVAAAARQDYPAAAQHAIAAGMAVAVAAATGIGGAAINIPAPASGSKGAPASAADAGASAGGGVTHITVNINAPNAVLTEAERGQMINNSIRATRRTFGPAAART